MAIAEVAEARLRRVRGPRAAAFVAKIIVGDSLARDDEHFLFVGGSGQETLIVECVVGTGLRRIRGINLRRKLLGLRPEARWMCCVVGVESALVVESVVGS